MEGGYSSSFRLILLILYTSDIHALDTFETSDNFAAKLIDKTFSTKLWSRYWDVTTVTLPGFGVISVGNLGYSSLRGFVTLASQIMILIYFYHGVLHSTWFRTYISVLIVLTHPIWENFELKYICLFASGNGNEVNNQVLAFRYYTWESYFLIQHASFASSYMHNGSNTKFLRASDYMIYLPFSYIAFQ